MKIKAYTHYDERTKKRYSRDFLVFSVVPKVDYRFEVNDLTVIVKSVFPILLDCEQPCDEVWLYDYYNVLTSCVDDAGKEFDYGIMYICVKREVI